MRARTTLLGAIGAVAGLTLALTAGVLPASAGKPGTGAGETSTTTSTTCSSMHGRTVTASWVSEVVTMKAGETLTAKVSPAYTGDKIILSVGVSSTVSLNEAPATSGIAFTAPSSTAYGLGWSYEAAGTRPSSLTWSFTCSSGGSTGGSTGGTVITADADKDGVADSADKCAATSLPDSVRPASGYYYANSRGVFVNGNGTSSAYTVVETAGCSAAQIAKSLGLKGKAAQSGITLTQLKTWADRY